MCQFSKEVEWKRERQNSPWTENGKETAKKGHDILQNTTGTWLSYIPLGNFSILPYVCVCLYVVIFIVVMICQVTANSVEYST